MKRITLQWHAARRALSLSKWLVAVAAAFVLSQAAFAQDAKIQVVAAENFYGDVVNQLGGDRVSVTSILSNPDEDPHLFEASPKTARALQNANLVVYNGADYDTVDGEAAQRVEKHEAHDDRRGGSGRQERRR